MNLFVLAQNVVGTMDLFQTFTVAFFMKIKLFMEGQTAPYFRSSTNEHIKEV